MIALEFDGTLPSFDVDPMKAMNEIADEMYWSVQLNCDRSGRPASWPLKKDGRASHLLKTGRLRRAIFKRAAVTGDGCESEVGISTNDVPYAAIHNFGGVIKNGFGRGIQIIMPMRKYIMFQDEDLEKYINILGNNLFEAITSQPIEKG